MTGAPGQPPVNTAEVPENVGNPPAPSETNGNLRPPEPLAPVSADPNAPEPGNER